MNSSILAFLLHRARRIRTSECRNQNPVPYRLAITLHYYFHSKGWVMGLEPTTPGTTIQCYYQLSYTHRISFVPSLTTCLIYHVMHTYVKQFFSFFLYFFIDYLYVLVVSVFATIQLSNLEAFSLFILFICSSNLKRYQT